MTYRFQTILSLKPEHTKAPKALLAGKDVPAILPTGFGESLIYHVFFQFLEKFRLPVMVFKELNDRQSAAHRTQCQHSEPSVNRASDMRFLNHFAIVGGNL